MMQYPPTEIPIALSTYDIRQPKEENKTLVFVCMFVHVQYMYRMVCTLNVISEVECLHVHVHVGACFFL